jgi:hypothetical protein
MMVVREKEGWGGVQCLGCKRESKQKRKKEKRESEKTYLECSKSEPAQM